MNGLRRWLEPLQAALPELGATDWDLLDQLDTHLRQLTASGPPADQAHRLVRLLGIRRQLAAAGYAMLTVPRRLGGAGQPAMLQCLAQFVCGCHDLDLRDATGLSHGALITRAASALVRDRWLHRIAHGDLVGIAATERHGGSRIQEITTCAALAHGGRWLITGEKAWVSRLVEASGLVVFLPRPGRADQRRDHRRRRAGAGT